jgi:DNA-binding transcriptional regulator YbjK
MNPTNEYNNADDVLSETISLYAEDDGNLSDDIVSVLSDDEDMIEHINAQRLALTNKMQILFTKYKQYYSTKDVSAGLMIIEMGLKLFELEKQIDGKFVEEMKTTLIKQIHLWEKLIMTVDDKLAIAKFKMQLNS